MTSVFIGLGIVFCGCAMVHNVFVWQKEKTNVVKEQSLQQNSYHTIISPNVLNQSHVSTAHIHPMQVQNNSAFFVRPSTTTPPNGDNLNLTKREVSGSISPALQNATLDLSSVTTTNSPHELSTLV